MSSSSASDRITCPACQASIKAPPLPPGSKCVCPKCGRAFALAGGPTLIVRPNPNTPGPTKPGPPSAAASPRPPGANPPASQPPSVPAARPPIVDEVLDPMLVSRAAAIASVQPAHDRDPGAPKPPPPKPKPVEIVVVCKLCGTRVHAKESQIGSKLKCPDCHSENEVLAPKKAPPARKGPSLDDTPEYGMSDPGERPAYRPLVRARDEDADLAAFDNGGQPAPPSLAKPRKVRPPQSGSEASENEEIVLGPAVERPSAAALSGGPASGGYAPAGQGNSPGLNPRSDLPSMIAGINPKPPPPHVKERGPKSWNDEDWGLVGDSRHPDAWKKSPFIHGVVDVLRQPHTIARMFGYSVAFGLGVALWIWAIQFHAEHPATGGVVPYAAPPSLGAGLLFSCGVIVCAVVFLLGFARCCQAIAMDTANGLKMIESWPDWNLAEGIGESLLLMAAVAAAGLPAVVVSGWLATMGAVSLALVVFVGGFLTLFPIVYASMLEEESMFMPISPKIMRSLKAYGETWMMFGMVSLVIGMLGYGVMSLMELGIVLLAPFIAGGLTALAFLYFRIFGRLLWVIHQAALKTTYLED